MERNGTVYISYNYTAEDYWRLDLRNTSSSNWHEAVNIFRDRIDRRFFDQIDALNARDAFKNGFATIALCCLLIDSMYQFEHGTNGHRYNKVKYKQTLREHMGDVFDTDEKAERFYCDIRCGILHAAETQNGSQLTVNNCYVVELFAMGDKISVDVVGLAGRLRQYIDEYCDRLYGGEQRTRKNFRKKMNLLCGRPTFFE